MKHLLVLLFYTGSLFSQTDILNQRDSTGKKTGYWKIFLDERTNPTDSANSSFYSFEWYDAGVCVSTYRTYRYKKRKRMVYYGPTLTKGKPIPIKGVFSWYDNLDELICEEMYENGRPLFLKSYEYPNKSFKVYMTTDVHTVVFEDLDYTKTYNNMPGTFFYQEHSMSDPKKIDKYWFRKGEKGWRIYKITE